MSATTTETDTIQLTLARCDIDVLRVAVKKLIAAYQRDFTTAKGRGRHGRAETIRDHLSTLSRFESALAAPEPDPDTGLPRVTHAPERPEVLRQELTRLYASCGPESPDDASDTADDATLEELATLAAGWAHRA